MVYFIIIVLSLNNYKKNFFYYLEKYFWKSNISSIIFSISLFIRSLIWFFISFLKLIKVDLLTLFPKFFITLIITSFLFPVNSLKSISSTLLTFFITSVVISSDRISKFINCSNLSFPQLNKFSLNFPFLSITPLRILVIF